MDDKNSLVVDDLPAENVKFIFYKIEEYIQNTPAELVTEVMERHKGWSIELTYEEAIPLVSISAIQEYVAEELSVKNMAFMLSECPQSAENLRAILARPFADFPADDIRRAYRDKVQAEASDSLLDWTKRVRRVSRNSIYTGTITLERRPGSPSLQKQCALERVELSNHQALVSKEQFERSKTTKNTYGNLTSLTEPQIITGLRFFLSKGGSAGGNFQNKTSSCQ